MPLRTFNEWLHDGDRYEALQDEYFEDQIGPGHEFLDWAESVYRRKLEEEKKNPKDDSISGN